MICCIPIATSGGTSGMGVGLMDHGLSAPVPRSVSRSHAVAVRHLVETIPIKISEPPCSRISASFSGSYCISLARTHFVRRSSTYNRLWSRMISQRCRACAAKPCIIGVACFSAELRWAAASKSEARATGMSAEPSAIQNYLTYVFVTPQYLLSANASTD